MEYAFTADVSGVTSEHYNAIGTSGSGFSGGNVSGGRRGTILVDIMRVNSDGSLAIAFEEHLTMPPDTHTHNAFQCNVYGNTAMTCPDYMVPSDEESVIVRYLGRQFVDGAPWDAKMHWNRNERVDTFTTTDDFSISGDADKNPVTVVEHKKTVFHRSGFATSNEDVTIVYDRTIEAPRSVNADVQSTSSGESDHSTFTYTLTADTFSHPAH
jgi:hypothetical protein